jgi:DNA polymerase I-like protein with 3'-5' exonuclease and polymerase domains
MPVIQTGDLAPGQLSGHIQHQVYNGLDCCVTLEVWEELTRQHNQWPPIYQFERALQAPYLEIINRGFAVDSNTRFTASQRLRERMQSLEGTLNILARGSWGKGLNPRSPLQLKDFFYSHLGLPEIWLSQKGQKKLSTNREALEKLDTYMIARPFVNCILAIRDIGKQLDVFESEIDNDGRFRTSYNIAGTETGRPSSSTSAFGTGGNAQNISPPLRYVFVADKGWKLCVIDLEQVEARDVGFFIGCLFGDWKFLDSCESGDLHTNNAKLIWPELPWTDDLRRNREIADRMFYRDFTYRDMAKRGSHLSNYSGTSWTASRSLKVPLGVMDEFQARYCRGGRIGGRQITPAFPGIPQWWQWTATQLETNQLLVTPFGRQRHFFGRPGDGETLREAIAFLPQSTTADRMNLGLWKVWKAMPQIQLLAQTYDSITFQAQDDQTFDDNVGRALELIHVELLAPTGRRYSVPGEAKVGWNWGNQVTERDQERARRAGRVEPRLNLEGLVKWKPGQDQRKRQTGFSSLAGSHN